NALTITAGFRDLFGNVVNRNKYLQTVSLYYTDPLIAPAEWPMTRAGNSAGPRSMRLKYRRATLLRPLEGSQTAFHVSPVKAAPGATTAQVMLQVRFNPLDDDKFQSGDIDTLQVANRVVRPAKDDTVAILLKSKFSGALLTLAEKIVDQNQRDPSTI